MVNGDLDWMQDGRCADVQTDAFFPERGTAQITARDAKEQCNGKAGQPACPIRSACLEFALERKERFGIWGGMSERERAAVAKERRVAAQHEQQAVVASIDRKSKAARKGWAKRRTNRRRAALPSDVTNYSAGLITLGELREELLRLQGQGVLTAGEVQQELDHQEHKTALAVNRSKGNRGTAQSEGRTRRVA